MYIDVIPLHHSLGNETLTYSVGDIFRPDIHIWCLVHIPFGNKETDGIVSAVHTAIPDKIPNTRDILGIITSTPIASEPQILSIIRLAQKYLLPIHRVAGFFFTEPLLKRLIKYQFPLQETPIPSPTESGIFLFQNHIIGAPDIHNHTSTRSVIIVPDDIFLYQIAPHFTGKDTLIMWHNDTPTKRAKAWIDIAGGKYQRIVWTRRLLYYNLKAYSEIAYIEDSFQREYFHFPIRILYTDILAYIHETDRIGVKIFSSIPRLSTLHTFRHLPIHHISSSCQKNQIST